MSTPLTTLVFGATGGIGGALVEQLRARGDTVLLSARPGPRLEAQAAATGCAAYPADATDEAQVGEAITRAGSEHGGLSGIALAVGSILLKPAHATSASDFDTTLRLNLLTAFHAVKHGAPALKARRGALLLFSSVAAQLGLPNHEAIAAAKAGVEGLARSAAATYAPAGVRINVLAPGLVRSALSERLLSMEAQARASAAMHPLGRVGEPADLAGIAAWLLGAESTWVTGQVLGVDGGLGRVKSAR